MNDPHAIVGQWLPEAQAGSREALGHVFESCRGYLWLIARQEMEPALQAKDSPSDLVQQTYLEAQRDLGSFQGTTPEAWLAWMRRLLLNNLANLRRDSRRAKRRMALEVSLAGGDPATRVQVELQAATNSPGAALIRDEEIQTLELALHRLPEDYRKVIQLRSREERSFQVIARLMGRSPNAVRKLWARALKKIQQELDASR